MTISSQQFTDLIAAAHAHPQADFYRTVWGAERSFESLPTVSRRDFLNVPLSRRRYKVEKALVKVVHDPHGIFLSEWAFADIAKEAYGLPSARPLVYMTNSGETIEKSMWCYGSGVVPLAGEKDPDIAMYAAGKYRVTSMIADADSLPKFRPYLDEHEPLESISVIGALFDAGALREFTRYAGTLRLVLSLPETGAFAEAVLSDRAPRFSALPGCLIERDGTLVVSKLASLVTPVIRYRTEIPVSLYDGA
jgi:hypothetical protein